MPVRKLRPINNSSRDTILINYQKTLTKDRPTASLLRNLKKKSGRDKTGQISVRHRGGGSRKKYRIIDFRRNKFNIPGIVKTFEYDPNRNAFISLILYADGQRRYILAPSGLKIGQKILSSTDEIDPQIGNSMPLKHIPEGMIVHNLELRPGQGGVMARSAGTGVQLLGLDDTKKYMIVKLSSGETRKILQDCGATIGSVGNEDNRLVKIGKAGRNRWRGKRPSVRGAAMNRCDHPHGGGEGKAPIGHKSPKTKWGKIAYGVKTRNRKKFSSKLIIRRRQTIR